MKKMKTVSDYSLIDLSTNQTKRGAAPLTRKRHFRRDVLRPSLLPFYFLITGAASLIYALWPETEALLRFAAIVFIIYGILTVKRLFQCAKKFDEGGK